MGALRSCFLMFWLKGRRRRSVSYLRNKHSTKSVRFSNIPWLSHRKHPFRYLTTRSSHDIDDTFEVRCVFFGEVCYRFTSATSTTCSTNSVNIALHCLREIVVDDEIHSFEIKTTCHQFGWNENPYAASSELIDNIVSLWHFSRIRHVKKTRILRDDGISTWDFVRSEWMTSTLIPSYTSSWKSSLARSMDWTKIRTGGFNPFCTICRMATSFPSSLPTKSNSCLMVSVAAFLYKSMTMSPK